MQYTRSVVQHPKASSPVVARNMSLHPRRDTGPEMAVRRLLHAAGERYRVVHKVPGAPRRTIDIAFTRARLAVFIDGCFWHGCPTHGQLPASNREWWAEKLANNRTRDADTTMLLVDAGWEVLRFWAHEPAHDVVGSIRHELGRRRRSTGPEDVPGGGPPDRSTSSGR
jgi:DNA mismatch endonuclease, patch repair protein